MTKFCAFAALVFCFCLTALDSAWAAQRESKTPYYALTLAADGSTIQSLSLDSLGHGEFRPSALFPPEAKATGAAANSAWRFEFSPKAFKMESVYSKDAPPTAMTLRFNPEVSHATLLAMVDGGKASLPAVLYLPEQGSLRIQAVSKRPVRLGYDAHRKGKGYVEVTFPAALKQIRALFIRST